MYKGVRTARSLSVIASLMLTLVQAHAGTMAGSTPLGSPLGRSTEHGSPGLQTSVHFSLDQSLESPTDFNLLLSEGEERVVSGQFFLDRLYTFRDLILEAKKFGFTEEAVGKDQPITTRFSNKDERAFIIDVSKRGIRTQFFITVSTETGHLTVDGGTVNRSDKRETGLMFEILKRLQTLIAKSTGQPIK